jgi:hypothetical protein
MPAATNAAVIFPNPATGPGPATLQITLASPAGRVTVSVYTTAFRKVNGLTLENLPAGTNDILLPLVDRRGNLLANGLYYVVVETPQGRLTARLLILR